MRAADAALLTSALHPLHGKPAFAGSVLTGALLAMVALFGGSSRRALRFAAREVLAVVPGTAAAALIPAARRRGIAPNQSRC